MGLIGRDFHQNTLSGLLDRAREGRSGVLAIVGEPGIGKTALLEQLISEVDGMSVLRARGVQSEAQIPFAALSELVRPALGFLDRIPAPQAEALEGALALTAARVEDRFALGAATLSLLAAFAELRPLLVVVDDAHWIDGSSASAMSFAFRRLVADPIAIVLAAREGEPSLLDNNDVPLLRLQGLDRLAGATLIGTVAGPVPDDVVERIHRQTGGNPLALLEAAREIDRFRSGLPLDTPLPIVTTVSEIYAARVRALPGPSRTALLLAAAGDIPQLSVVRLAATTIGLDVGALAAAEARGLIRLSDGRLEFPHPLVRAAVYNDAAPEERRQAHRALASALPDAEMDRRAWHLCLATPGPDDTACLALEQAALRGRDRNAYDVASTTFERAAQMAPDEGRQGRLLYQAADSAWSAGLADRACDLLERARSHVGTIELALDVDHLRGQIATRVGPVADGLAILVSVAERAADVDPERAVIMFAEAINAAFYAGDTHAMRVACDRITSVGLTPMSDDAMFFGTMARGMALIFTGETKAGTLLVREAVQLVDRNREPVNDARWLTWAAMGPLWLRDNDAGRALIERATHAARQRVAIGVLPYLLCHVAIDHAATDRWSDAESAFHEVIRLARETHQRTDLAAALARLAWLEAKQGREVGCLQHAGEAIDLADELGLTLCRIWALAALGESDLAQGRATEAVIHFEEQQALLRTCEIDDVDLWPAPELVELYLRIGSVERAAEFTARYSDRARVKGQPWAVARATRCRGLLAAAADIDGVFTEALDIHAQTPDNFETARTHLAYGSRLRRGGRRTAARQQLRSAIELFDALGSEPWSVTARLELAATGETARRRNVSTRNRLTPQELQIALLLAARHTTREAAASLFLSPKTIEYHLRSIYRKLGCNNRDDLAAAMKQPS